jgi:hypothetical protein
LAPTPTALLPETLRTNSFGGAYWLDMADSTLVLVMTNGIGAHLSNDEKRAHLSDLKREHLIDRVCVQEILLPEKN